MGVGLLDRAALCQGRLGAFARGSVVSFLLLFRSCTDLLHVRSVPAIHSLSDTAAQLASMVFAGLSGRQCRLVPYTLEQLRSWSMIAMSSSFS